MGWNGETMSKKEKNEKQQKKVQKISRWSIEMELASLCQP